MIRGGLRGVKEWAEAIESIESGFWRGLIKTTMTMKITYPDGSTEIIPEATKVDSQNFHEGMYDFYDNRGNLLRQIDMHNLIKWELTEDNDD